MYLDDLPIWGIVGEIDQDDHYIWTHKKFEIGYNKWHDTRKFFSSNNAVPQLYSIIDGKAMIISGSSLPTDKATVIPLGVAGRHDHTFV